MIRIQTFSGGDFAENGYLVVCGEKGPGIVIDPGASASSMAKTIEDEQIQLDAIVLTHAHLDHVEGVPEIRALAPEAPIFLHADDGPLYQSVEMQARAFNLPSVGTMPPPTDTMVHGEELTFGECRFQIRHAPGHAPGHVILYCEEEKAAFVGDVVFLGAIGRADLPGGDFHQLMDSIRTQVLSLPDDTRLLTGHGPETTVGWERRTNPFLVGQYGGERV
ncbi:MAG: MBL fold metallo-hydrolase [Gemmatimonadetes bacterium]|nr:MBL fold metallo-hydrolase [Gemmatimonadota bacterium]NNM07417.1 MBL fold metallo-hydrolase [Gemmatimonadota bacterium]